jgi:hypothetical protein
MIVKGLACSTLFVVLPLWPFVWARTPRAARTLFTLTMLEGGKDIAVLNGSADSVQPGQTATAQLISESAHALGGLR